MKLVITQANLTLKGGAERVLLKIAQHYDAKIYTAEYDPAKTFEGFEDADVEAIGRQGLLKETAIRKGIAGTQLRAFLLQLQDKGRLRCDKRAHSAQPLDKEEQRARALVLPHAH